MASELSVEELARVDAIATAVRFNPNSTLIFEGDQADRVYNITDGVVRLTRLMADGRRAVTGFLYPGQFLGLAFGGRFSYTAEAITDVEACVFARTALDREFQRMPKLEHRLLTMVSNELIAAQDQMMLLGRKKPREKLASFLLQIATHCDDDDVADIPMSRSDIADYLGLTIETVSRTFTKFTDKGLIRAVTRRKIELLDRSALENLADEGEA